MGLHQLTKHFFSYEPEGLIYRANVVAGWLLKLYTIEAVIKTLRAVDRQCEMRVRVYDGPPLPTHENLVPLIVEALKDVCSTISPRPAPRFAENGLCTGSERFATVVPVNALRKYLLAEAAIEDIEERTQVILPEDSSKGLTLQQWRTLVDKGPYDLEIRTGGSLGFPLLWFTTQHEVERVRIAGPRDEFADRLRDALGLVHHKANVGLFLISFSRQVLLRRVHYRPIFLDASTHVRFKTRCSQGDAGEPAIWGQTADLLLLEKAANDEALIDGVVERVAQPLPHDAFVGAKLRFEAIGPIQKSRDVHPSAHMDFAGRLGYYNVVRGVVR
jgi:hypothetical protein